ncbi:hypothetical protein HK105_200015 [Polyrhizophydium stewartii]|uniref:EF-hand domain-containing protein n=1 Tax=Polyrhizophydium stewartii TaxID=2732419 RepID=A0ABR4NKF8_9FUNG
MLQLKGDDRMVAKNHDAKNLLMPWGLRHCDHCRFVWCRDKSACINVHFTSGPQHEPDPAVAALAALTPTSGRLRAVTTRTFKLSETEQAEIQDSFSLFDHSGLGRITAKEARIAMRALSHDTTKQEFQQIFKKSGQRIDNGIVHLDQFVAVMRFYLAEKQAQQEMTKLYQAFLALGKPPPPPNALAHSASPLAHGGRARALSSSRRPHGADGKLDIQAILNSRKHEHTPEPVVQHTNEIREDHIRRVASILGEQLSDEDVRDMMEEADRDGDGFVNQDDFLRLMRKTDAGAKKSEGSRGSMSIIGDAILAETIKKELRYFRLNEKYMLSPNVIKNLVVTNKPTDPIVSVDDHGEEDPALFDDAIKKHFASSKFVEHDPNETPKTSSSVYGWDTKPLVRVTDRRFYHPKTVTEITKMYGTCVIPGDKPKGNAKAGSA